MYQSLGELEIQEDIYAYFRWNNDTGEIEILNSHEKEYKIIDGLKADSKKDAITEAYNWTINRSYKSQSK